MNCAQAQYFLGGCYVKSIGTRYDKEKARVWMMIAMANGSRAAGEFLKKADWVPSPEEERGIHEMLKGGKTTALLSGSLRAALREVVGRSGGVL